MVPLVRRPALTSLTQNCRPAPSGLAVLERQGRVEAATCSSPVPWYRVRGLARATAAAEICLLLAASRRIRQMGRAKAVEVPETSASTRPTVAAVQGLRTGPDAITVIASTTRTTKHTAYAPRIGGMLFFFPPVDWRE